MTDHASVNKEKLNELGLPVPLDEFELNDEARIDTDARTGTRETLSDRPEVAEKAAEIALQETVVRSQESANVSVPELINDNLQLKTETVQESGKQDVLTKAVEVQPVVQPTTNNLQPTIQKDPEVARIESTISAGLKEEYMKMPPTLQQKFRIEGEKTAIEINKLLHKTKVNVRKIISLIRKWLSLIPGVSKFFLDQEAKIKGDAVVKKVN